MILGIYLGKEIDGSRLKHTFGLFVGIIALSILAHQALR